MKKPSAFEQGEAALRVFEVLERLERHRGNLTRELVSNPAEHIEDEYLRDTLNRMALLCYTAMEPRQWRHIETLVLEHLAQAIALEAWGANEP
jgi:hypothetical protein